jgi:transcription termination factor Rho
MAERRLYPAIDVTASGTRREELLFSEEELAAVSRLRRYLIESSDDPIQRTERLLGLLAQTTSNAELLAKIDRLPARKMPV